MLTPKIIQLPDYSEYIGKEFIITEDLDKKIFGRPFLKGVRFIIKKINNTKVTIKVSNTKPELEELGMLEYDFNRIIKETEKDIKVFKKIIKMWTDEPDKFIIDEDSYWNGNRDGDGRGHCINTGFHGIPADHPDKYGMAKARYYNGKLHNDDSIMTLDYKRIDDKLNIYSYQKGNNVYYSKNCYEFMCMSEEQKLIDWKNRIAEYKKWVLGWILEKQEVTVKTLNKITFEKL